MKQRNCKNKRYIPVPSHSSRHGINFWHKMLQQQVKKANAICLKINDLEFVLLHCWKRTLALLAVLVFPRFHQKVLKCNAISNSQGLRWEMERLLLRNNSWYFTEMTSPGNCGSKCVNVFFGYRRRKLPRKKNPATEITIRGQLSDRGHQANREGSDKGGNWPPDHVGIWKTKVISRNELKSWD